ncbi:Chromatin assembly factor 1 subunit p50 [Candida viswanathii]|uniref:Chromatin assembly factor 1 subunit p50 n=1 Tax=Candida viswanathii TaxID=5486 RepID=A0A367YQW4_9ASCO|nr:Chromatin assembly factor 1 subunit p50 [Candida viswanathii]
MTTLPATMSSTQGGSSDIEITEEIHVTKSHQQNGSNDIDGRGDDAATEQQQEEDTSPIDENTENKYRVWKKNTPLLYDYLSTNTLLWPSLSVQFFPDITHVNEANGSGKDEEDIVSQRVLLGTFTLGQAIDHISILQIPSFKNLNKNIKISKLDFNPEKEELELSTSSVLKTKVLQKINHLGDVNRARYMPQKPNIIASANNLGDLVIYERTRHKSFRNTMLDDTEMSEVQMKLSNKHIQSTADIFAIDWNQNEEGLLLSGDMNGIINLYDLTKYEAQTLHESKYWENNAIGINDIEWLPTHDSLFAAADDAGNIKVYDIRAGNAIVYNKNIGNNVNSIALNPGYSTGLASGDNLGVIKTWDLRNFDTPIGEIDSHADSITQLKWHPKFHNVIGSSSTDHLVKLHNAANNSTIFSHLGHMLGVNDFDWSFADDWMVASVADDNSLHVWKPTHTVTSQFE